MKMVLLLAEVVLLLWGGTILFMLPVYFIRRKRNPNNEMNTIKSLVVNSLIASVVISVIMCSGLIVMYFDELKGIYK